MRDDLPQNGSHNLRIQHRRDTTGRDLSVQQPDLLSFDLPRPLSYTRLALGRRLAGLPIRAGGRVVILKRPTARTQHFALLLQLWCNTDDKTLPPPGIQSCSSSISSSYPLFKPTLRGVPGCTAE